MKVQKCSFFISLIFDHVIRDNGLKYVSHCRKYLESRDEKSKKSKSSFLDIENFFKNRRLTFESPDFDFSAQLDELFNLAVQARN